MKKSILAILATVSIGATGLEAGNAHAAENTNQNYNFIKLNRIIRVNKLTNIK